MAYSQDSDPEPLLWEVSETSANSRKPAAKQRDFLSTPLGIATFITTNVVIVAAVAFVISTLRGGAVEIAARDYREIQRESVEAFTTFDQAVPVEERLSPELAEEYFAIVQFLREVEKTAQDEDDEAFQELVDIDGLFQRILLTGALDNWSRESVRQGKQAVQEGVTVERWWQQIVVADVIEDPSADNALIVYAYGMEEGETLLDGIHQRFTLTRDGDSFKLADWLRLEFGLSQSQEWAAKAGLDDDRGVDGYERWSKLIVQADAEIEGGDEAAAKRLIRLAEKQPITTGYHDYHWVLTAYRWRALGDEQEAKRCYLKVRNPDRVPAAYQGLADCEPRYASQQAVDNLQKIEDLIGPSYFLSQQLAYMHRALGDKEYAAKQWKQILRFDPENLSALTGLMQQFPAESKSEIATYLERAEDPEGLGTQLASSMRYLDQDSFDYLLEYLQENAPNSASTLSVLAMSAEMEGDFKEARQQYLLAMQMEKDEEKQQDFVNRFLSAATEAGTLVEDWNEVPKPEAAFESLTYEYDEGMDTFSRNEFEAIVEKFLEQRPQDLRGLYYAAQSALRKEQFREAIELLESPLDGFSIEEGVEQSDEYDEEYESKKSLLELFAQAIHETMTLEVAYQQLRSRSAPLSMIASPLIESREWEKVDQLVSLHRKRDPSDKEIEKVLATKAYALEEWDAACKHLKNVLAKEDEDSWWLMFQYRDSCINSGRWREYYDAEATDKQSRADVFRELASQLRREKRWDDYDELIRLFQRESSPFSPSNLYEEAVYHWERKNYQRCAATCNQLLSKVDHGGIFAEDTLDEYALREIRDYRLRSLLKTKRYEKAQELAEQLKREHDDEVSVAIVAAAQGNHTNAVQLALDALEEDDGSNAYEYYQDECLGDVFLSKEYKLLHEKSPAGIPYVATENAAVFFFPQRPEIDGNKLESLIEAVGDPLKLQLQLLGREQLLNRLRTNPGMRSGLATLARRERKEYRLPVFAELGDCESVDGLLTLPSGEEVKVHYFLFDDCTLWFATGEGPFSKRWSWPEEEKSSTKNLSWMVFGSTSWTESQSDRARPTLRYLASELAGESARYFGKLSYWSNSPNAIYRASPELLEAWQRDESLAPFASQRILVNHEESAGLVLAQRNFRHALQTVARDWRKSSEADLRVLVRIGGSRFAEIGWAKVEKAELKYGEWQFTVKFLEASQTISAINTELPLLIPQDEVRAFRWGDNQPVLAPSTY